MPFEVLLWEQSFTHKLGNYFERVVAPFLEIFEQFFVVGTSLVELTLPFDNVANLQSALFGALSVSSETVFVEAVTAHEVDRRERKAVETLGTVVRLESFGLCLELAIVVTTFSCLLCISSNDLAILVNGDFILLELVQEELLHILVLNILVLGQDGKDKQRRKRMDLFEVLQNLGNECFPFVFRFGKVLQGVHPQVHLLASVELAQLDDLLIVTTADVKI